ncbi:hypothetical protein ON010_g13575 [Phytophthora cinnamomi]|nr:hypothetical protein ON010_g13575 [Phytophthora cinnamomi]
MSGRTSYTALALGKKQALCATAATQPLMTQAQLTQWATGQFEPHWSFQRRRNPQPKAEFVDVPEAFSSASATAPIVWGRLTILSWRRSGATRPDTRTTASVASLKSQHVGLTLRMFHHIGFPPLKAIGVLIGRNVHVHSWVGWPSEPEKSFAAATISSSLEDGPPSLGVSPPTNRSPATVRRMPRSTQSSIARVSPHPLRDRTPPQLFSPSAPPVRRQARVSLDTWEENEGPGDAGQQLIVHSIVKGTMGELANSGKLLEGFVPNGATLKDIVHKLWEKFSPRVKGPHRAARWCLSIKSPTEAA